MKVFNFANLVVSLFVGQVTLASVIPQPRDGIVVETIIHEKPDGSVLASNKDVKSTLQSANQGSRASLKDVEEWMLDYTSKDGDVHGECYYFPVTQFICKTRSSCKLSATCQDYGHTCLPGQECCGSYSCVPIVLGVGGWCW